MENDDEPENTAEETKALIGAAIRLRRRQLLLGSEEAAERADVKRVTWTHWEHSFSPTPKNKDKVRKALGYYSETVMDNMPTNWYPDCCHEIIAVSVFDKRGGLNKRGFPRWTAGRPSRGIHLLPDGVHIASMEPMLLEIAAGDASVEVAAKHEGQEIIYVLRGEVRFEYVVNGKTKNPKFKANTLIYFSSNLPHRLVNTSKKQELHLLIIKSPPDRYTKCTLKAVNKSLPKRPVPKAAQDNPPDVQTPLDDAPTAPVPPGDTP